MPLSIKVNLRVTGHCNQGGRKYMEDMFSVAYQQTSDDKDLEYAFFGIFDGHGGVEAATYAKEHLMDIIVKQKNFWSDNDDDVCRAIRDGYMNAHYSMWGEVETWPKTASGLPSTAGTTASIAFIRKGKIYIGHVGDSAIILGYQDKDDPQWRARPLTRDHKPESTTEKRRIQESGGKVVNKSGVPRVVWNRPRIGHKGPVRRSTHIDEIPFLAVARSLGDLWSYNSELDTFVVSPEPDVNVFTIDVESHRCLIFGTDGLWNMLTPEAAVEIVQAAERHNEKHFIASQQTGSGADTQMWINPSKSLVDRALERWTTSRLRADNTSVVTLMLDPPGPSRGEVLLNRKKERVLSHAPLHHANPLACAKIEKPMSAADPLTLAKADTIPADVQPQLPAGPQQHEKPGAPVAASELEPVPVELDRTKSFNEADPVLANIQVAEVSSSDDEVAAFADIDTSDSLERSCSEHSFSSTSTVVMSDSARANSSVGDMLSVQSELAADNKINNENIGGPSVRQADYIHPDLIFPPLEPCVDGEDATDSIIDTVDDLDDCDPGEYVLERQSAFCGSFSDLFKTSEEDCSVTRPNANQSSSVTPPTMSCEAPDDFPASSKLRKDGECASNTIADTANGLADDLDDYNNPGGYALERQNGFYGSFTDLFNTPNNNEKSEKNCRVTRSNAHQPSSLTQSPESCTTQKKNIDLPKRHQQRKVTFTSHGDSDTGVDTDLDDSDPGDYVLERCNTFYDVLPNVERPNSAVTPDTNCRITRSNAHLPLPESSATLRKTPESKRRQQAKSACEPIAAKSADKKSNESALEDHQNYLIDVYPEPDVLNAPSSNNAMSGVNCRITRSTTHLPSNAVVELRKMSDASRRKTGKSRGSLDKRAGLIGSTRSDLRSTRRRQSTNTSVEKSDKIETPPVQSRLRREITTVQPEVASIKRRHSSMLEKPDAGRVCHIEEVPMKRRTRSEDRPYPVDENDPSQSKPRLSRVYWPVTCSMGSRLRSPAASTSSRSSGNNSPDKLSSSNSFQRRSLEKKATPIKTIRRPSINGTSRIQLRGSFALRDWDQAKSPRGACSSNDEQSVLTRNLSTSSSDESTASFVAPHRWLRSDTIAATSIKTLRSRNVDIAGHTIPPQVAHQYGIAKPNRPKIKIANSKIKEKAGANGNGGANGSPNSTATNVASTITKRVKSSPYNPSARSLGTRSRLKRLSK